jgi:hypothetical protein
MSRRRRVQYLAAAAATVISAIYFLIGFQVVTVIEEAADQPAFALPAAIAFALGALVILAFDKRWLWIAGSGAQLLIILMYFSVSSQREPAFEIWGITIRVAQTLLLAALTYLAMQRRQPATGAATPSPTYGVAA